MVNGGFESPYQAPGTFSLQAPSNIPGWQTTDTAIEIWGSGFQGVPAAEGNQFAELNAYINGTLFQEVTGIGAGLEVGFEFFHRARVGTDEMNLAITDLGIDGVFGGGDDTALFTKNYFADTTAWVKNTNAGEAPIITLGNKLRFAYSAVSTGSGNAAVGNFLDGAKFGVGVGAVTNPTSVPEPATILGLLAFGALGATSLKRKQKATVV